MALFRRSTGMEIITQGPELRLIVNAKCTQLDVRVTDHFPPGLSIQTRQLIPFPAIPTRLPVCRIEVSKHIGRNVGLLSDPGSYSKLLKQQNGRLPQRGKSSKLSLI